MKADKLKTAIFISAFLALGSTAFADPAIQILGASPYGSISGEVWGKVTGVADYSACKVIVFIKVADTWLVKPHCKQPFTEIQPDGNWRTSITTEDLDDFADYIIAYLLPSAINAKSIPCSTYCQPDGIPEYHACTIYDRQPSKRVLTFAGSKWRVRTSELPSRPGDNVFSNDPSDVWIDGTGQLHLTITDKGDHWESTEVVQQASLGRGVYMVQTNSRLDRNDPHSVTGAFTWDPWICDGIHRELDWEISKWAEPANPTNTQFVVQPCRACPGCADQCVRFSVRPTNSAKYITTYIIWDSKKVEFRSYHGEFTDFFPPADFLIKKWAYKNRAGIPAAGKENFRLNLWLFDARRPADGKRQEVVFSNFNFAARAITVDGVSDPGALAGYLRGSVTQGVPPEKYKVEVYIQVNGKWWSKPAFAKPFTRIAPDRTWTAPITTGEHDKTATRVMALLMPVDKGPHLAAGLDNIPAEALKDSISRDEIIRR